MIVVRAPRTKPQGAPKLVRALAFLAGMALALVTARAGAVVVRTAVAYRPAPVYRAPVYHPVARTAAVVGTTAVTAAVVGSVVSTLPPSCSSVVVNGIAYQQCGSAWYQPSYAGTTVNYTVVNPPR
jgi:hypothetical protein